MRSLQQQAIPFFITLLLVLCSTGCVKRLREKNVDPTGTSGNNFNPYYMLTTAQLRYTGSADFGHECYLVQMAYLSTMMQYFATTTTPNWYGDKYITDPLDASRYFTAAYSEQVKFVVDGLQLAKNNSKYYNLYQVLRIWKVVIFHRLTDLYGDVPYFEAGLGFYYRHLTPRYDAQEAIYDDMLNELREAAQALDVTHEMANADFIYFGNVKKWKKLAYSMMLRLSMRLTKVKPAAAKRWVEEAYRGGLFESSEDNALIQHDGTGGRLSINRISNNFIERGETIAGVKWSRRLIDFLKDNDDPRLQILAEVPQPGGTGTIDVYGAVGNNDPALQVGMPNGYDLGSARSITTEPRYPGAVGGNVIGKYSRPRNTILFRANSPTYVITYGEVALLLAEAAMLGYAVGGDAATYYNEGVRGAMERWSGYDGTAVIFDAAMEAYLAAHPFNAAEGYKMIGEQYWLATILNEYEGFANWRRTGYPQLTPVHHPSGSTAGVIPRRMLYPETEAVNNTVNYKAALDRMGGVNSMLSRVWWDKP